MRLLGAFLGAPWVSPECLCGQTPPRWLQIYLSSLFSFFSVLCHLFSPLLFHVFSLLWPLSSLLSPLTSLVSCLFSLFSSLFFLLSSLFVFVVVLLYVLSSLVLSLLWSSSFKCCFKPAGSGRALESYNP